MLGAAGDVVIRADLVDVETGGVEASAQARGADVFDLVDRVAAGCARASANLERNRMSAMNILPWIVAALLGAPDPDVLRVTLVGNAGVLLTDGETSLLVDLPYESGYSGYEEYEFSDLAPEGRVVSVITHHHLDHFDPTLFSARGWEVIGPASVTDSLDPGAVLAGDSAVVGRFHVVALDTPHTADHRSYRVRWGGRIFHFTGDTEDPASLNESPPLDVLFITPWLSCAAARADVPLPADRAIAYHLRPDRGDRICASAEVLGQGSSFEVEGRTG